MARTILLQDDWSLGAKPDVPKEKLARGGCYALTDAWPNLDAPIRKRGGWNRQWNATATGNYIAGVGFAPFSNGYRVLTVTDGEALYVGTYGSATQTSVGTVVNLAHPPVFYRDTAYFLDLDGTAAVRALTMPGGTPTLANAAGSPPTGSVGCVWKDHLVIARTNAAPHRVYFSEGGDPAAWNTAAPDAGGQTWDMTNRVQGMAVIKGMILVFEDGMTERLRGDIIPGVVGSDMVREPIFQIGCSDPASIATTDDYVIFANSAGVYFTDGTNVADFSKLVGISNDWKTTLSGYSMTWTIAAGMHRGYYVCSIMDGATFKGAYWFDISNKTAGKLTNVEATMIASTPIGMIDLAPKLIMGERAAARTSDLTTMWTPSATYKNDGDGDAVTWSMESPFYLGRRGLKRHKRLWSSYFMSDAASDNPTLTVSYNLDLAGTSYTSIGTLAETTTWECEPLSLDQSSEGFQIKVAQTNASADTRFYSLEVEQEPMEQSRRER